MIWMPQYNAKTTFKSAAEEVMKIVFPINHKFLEEVFNQAVNREAVQIEVSNNRLIAIQSLHSSYGKGSKKSNEKKHFYRG